MNASARTTFEETITHIPPPTKDSFRRKMLFYEASADLHSKSRTDSENNRFSTSLRMNASARTTFEETITHIPPPTKDSFRRKRLFDEASAGVVEDRSLNFLVLEGKALSLRFY